MHSCVSKRVENSVQLAEIISGEMRLTGGRGGWLNWAGLMSLVLWPQVCFGTVFFSVTVQRSFNW